MSLNKVQLGKLNKDELIDYAVNIQDKYNENLGIVDQLKEAMTEISSIISTVDKLNHHITELESTLLVTKNVNDRLVERIVDLERQVNSNSQYSRRDCLEITGIPSSVDNDKLESKVCDIFSEINVNVAAEDIQACHRLKNDKTIVKFVNRKHCINVLKKRSLLKDCNQKDFGFPEENKIFINESLCPEYRFLFWKCRVLHKNKKLFSYWTFNGIIKIKMSERGEIHAITHVNDLVKLFPGVNFSDK